MRGSELDKSPLGTLEFVTQNKEIPPNFKSLGNKNIYWKFDSQTRVQNRNKNQSENVDLDSKIGYLIDRC
jgi:hypothetical protein